MNHYRPSRRNQNCRHPHKCSPAARHDHTPRRHRHRQGALRPFHPLPRCRIHNQKHKRTAHFHPWQWIDSCKREGPGNLRFLGCCRPRHRHRRWPQSHRCHPSLQSMTRSQRGICRMRPGLSPLRCSCMQKCPDNPRFRHHRKPHRHPRH